MISLVKIPNLNKLIIQNYVGLSSFQKGEEYAINRAIHQGKLKNYVLTGLCQGHEFDPYRVEIIFNPEGILQSYCSCPVGIEGKCKHVAALLLTWLEAPEEFTEWKDLKVNLQSYDAATLLELIDLLDDKLGNSHEAIRAFSQHLQAVKSPRLAKYARRIEDAFHISEFPWYHPDEGGATEIAFALDKIRSDADQLLEEGQIEEAIRINQGLVQKILNHLDDYLGSWQNLNAELKRCIQSLNTALHHLVDKQEELRLKVFQILFCLIEEQLHREIDIEAEEAKEVLLHHVRPSERDKVISWVEAIQQSQIHPSQESKARSLEAFLIDLQRDVLDADVYLTYYQETGQTLKLVDSLLMLGRVKEAKHIAQQEGLTSQVLSLADVFVKYHQDSIAEELVLALIQKYQDLQALYWLSKFYQQRERLEEFLRVAKQIFYLSPQLSHYQTIRNVAQKLNQWSGLRQEIIEHFKKLQNKLLLIQIYLDEELLEEAIEAFENISNLSFSSLKEPQYLLLALHLASTAIAKHPRFSLKIYQDIVDHFIRERNRESYRKACEHLKTIQSIFENLQQRDEWEIYLSTLLQTYRRLKAFHEEVYLSQK
jgi:uncharacterized Zn finger protein